jgi:hypothetical protein
MEFGWFDTDQTRYCGWFLIRTPDGKVATRNRNALATQKRNGLRPLQWQVGHRLQNAYGFFPKSSNAFVDSQKIPWSLTDFVETILTSDTSLPFGSLVFSSQHRDAHPEYSPDFKTLPARLHAGIGSES